MLLTENKAPCLNFVKLNSIYFDLILKRTKCDCSQLFLFFGAKIGSIGVSFKGSAATKSRTDKLNVTRVGSCDNCLFHRKENLVLGRM